MLGLSLLAILITSAPALSATITDRPLLFSFDGSDTTAGEFARASKLDIHEATGTVYVIDLNKAVIDKFNLAGEAQGFSATGQSSLPLSPESSGALDFRANIAVDNSAANPGRIYFSDGGLLLQALAPSGNVVWKLSNIPNCGLWIDTGGELWVSGGVSDGKVRRFASTGNPPAQVGDAIDVSQTVNPCQIAVDSSDNLFVGQGGGGAEQPGATVDKYVDGAFDSVLDPSSDTFDISVDQTKPDGHIFVDHANLFHEYDSQGALVGRFGEGTIGEVSGSGIAYDAALDRVYLSTGGEVMVFGPTEAIGTAPDVTIEPVSSTSLTTAHFSGTINPLGLENSYHFEYKQGTKPLWSSGVTSSPIEHIVPADNGPHAVAFDVSGLESFTQYQVRLVATNDESGIENISKALTFGTGRFAGVTIAPPTDITAHTAKISGTVDPKESNTTWRFQTSTNPRCATGAGFSNGPTHVLEANSGVTAVEEELSGLPPNQHVCARIAATNSPGTATSQIKEFNTLPLPPLVALRGAAPRTQTTARLNAFVNPENAPTSYRFEYSSDGVSWTALPDHDLTAGTDAVLVSEELSALQPDTGYRFRVRAENLAGPTQSEAQAFTTLPAPAAGDCPNADVRTAQRTAYLGACRGIELVNSPEKGNQEVRAFGPGLAVHTAPITPDGQRVLWSVTGGAPGAPNATENSFLAERGAAGWHSTAAAPPAAEQWGGGDFAYYLVAASEDFRSFLFSVHRPDASGTTRPPPTVVRVRDGVQDVLKEYTVAPNSSAYETSIDLSDDGSHVLFVEAAAPAQLEDIGSARVGPPPVGGETVSLMPGGGPSACGLDFNGLSFPGVNGSGIGHPGYHMVATTDASRVYFRVPPDGECGGLYGLYVRNREAGQTTLIAPGSGGRSPEFLRTSADGRRALYVTRSSCRRWDQESLACESEEAADGGDDGADLYRWDEESGESSCLSCVAEVPARLAETASGATLSLLASADLSHVYFLSEEKLIAGLGTAGRLNLYLLDEGQLRFVAAVGADVLGNLPELSADGELLAFRAPASAALTADPVAPVCRRPNGDTGQCEELYLYDEREESLECVSCRSGAETSHSLGSNNGRPFVLSADGSTLAFTTAEALLPADVNGIVDAYEWRAGVLHLVSDGVSEYAGGGVRPTVWGIDAAGRNILFSLAPPGGSLTGYEHDGVPNLYTARTDGGFPPPSAREVCEGEGCQGPLEPPPALPTGGGGFAGAGNPRPAPPRCRRGKVRRHGRCVRRRAGPHKRKGQGRHKRRATGQGRQR